MTSKDVIYNDIDVYGVPTDIDRIIVAQARVESGGTWTTWDMISTNRGYTWTIVEEQGDMSNEVKGLGIQIDKDVATEVRVAYWDKDRLKLFVGLRTIALAVSGTDEDFGTSSEAELDAEDFILEIYMRKDPSVTSNEDYVISLGEFRKV